MIKMVLLVILLVFSTIVIIAVIYLKWRRRTVPWRNLAFLLFILLFPGIIITPYILLNYNTKKYWSEVMYAVRQSQVIGLDGYEVPIRKMQILSINSSQAKVYVVTPALAANKVAYVGGEFSLTKHNGRWIPDEMERTLWSNTGTADDNIFPPDTKINSYQNMPVNLYENPAISDNGRYIVYRAWGLKSNGNEQSVIGVFLVDRKTKRRFRCDSRNDIMNSFMPAISADGNYVTFVSSLANGRMVVFKYNVSSKYLKEICQIPPYYYSLNISDDGSKIFLVASDETNAGIFLCDEMTASCRLLIENNVGRFSISGGSRFFLVNEQDRNARLLVLQDLLNNDYKRTVKRGINSPIIGAMAHDKKGEIITFCSPASNLVPADYNGHDDVFIFDVLANKLSLISISSNGEKGDGESGILGLDVSANGRYITFQSRSSNLSHDKLSTTSAVFLHDRYSRSTKLISNVGKVAYFPKISGDGRYIVFQELSPSLQDGYVSDTVVNRMYDINSGKLSKL